MPASRRPAAVPASVARATPAGRGTSPPGPIPFMKTSRFQRSRPAAIASSGSRRLLFTSLLAALVLAGPAAAAAEPAPPPAVELAFPLVDLAGTRHDLGDDPGGRVRVIVFLSTECPIANGSLPALAAAARRFARGADLFGVVSDPTVSRAAAARHFAGFDVPYPVLFDASGKLREALGPTHVPEAFVVDPAGRLVYRGAIDNAWEAVGRRRPQTERHFLTDAVAATIAGRPVSPSRTAPVGCPIEPPPAAADTTAVSYCRDIAPIVQARCLGCHRDGQAAPFPLADYGQVAKRAGQIVEVTRARTMPPWMPAAGHEPLVGERRLTDREIDLLAAWERAGRPRGDEDDLPPAPRFAAGWQLGEPDLVVRLAEPFTVPADGPDILRNFVIPLDVPEDKLVSAIEFHPGNPRVVHHAVLFLDAHGVARRLDAATPEPGYERFGGPGFLPSGALGGWSVGNTPRHLPGGMGRHLKKGSDLVVQMHYHPTGRPETDRSEIGIFFVKKPIAESLAEPARLVGSIWAASYRIDMAPGDAAYAGRASYVLPREVIMVGVVPHMHLLGRSMRATATLPDGTVRPLVDVPDWNYSWQDEYLFERPFPLPAGTRLDVAAVWDNSAGNPSNPSSPPRRVTWGDGTTDEMMFCFFLIAAPRTEDLVHVIFDNLAHDARQPRPAALAPRRRLTHAAGGSRRIPRSSRCRCRRSRGR